MILVLGGTADTAPVAEALAGAGYSVLVSTATELPLAVGPARRRTGPLDEAGLAALVEAEGIRAVVDATHPYAQGIRALAPRVCRRLGVPYLSYLRPATGVADGERAADHREAARLACADGRPVLVATGSRHLGVYAAEARRTGVALVARVLPCPESRETCRQAGLAPAQVVEARGPFGVEENRRLLRERGIGVLVTKDGGAAGGFAEKAAAAAAEGCRLVVVERPPAAGAGHPRELLADLARSLAPSLAGAPPQDHGGNRAEVQARLGLGELLDFSASINPLGCPEGLQACVAAAWPSVLHYPDRRAAPLREALARRTGLAPEALAIGNGSAELLDLALRVLAPRRLVTCPPDFGLYGRLVPPGTATALVPRVEAQGFAPDLGALARGLAPGDAVLFSNPGNPSGHPVAAPDLQALLGRVRAAGATLVLDEAFADFCPGVSLLGEAGRDPHLVVLRSLTKIYAIPGLRLGYLGAHPTLVARLEALQVPWSVNALAQAAGAYCLGVEGWGARSRAFVARARERLAEALGALPGLEPLASAANYLLVRVGPPGATAAYEACARRGVLVRHCGSFGLGERYLRVAVRTDGENDRLVAALAGARGEG